MGLFKRLLSSAAGRGTCGSCGVGLSRIGAVSREGPGAVQGGACAIASATPQAPLTGPGPTRHWTAARGRDTGPPVSSDPGPASLGGRRPGRLLGVPDGSGLVAGDGVLDRGPRPGGGGRVDGDCWAPGGPLAVVAGGGPPGVVVGDSLRPVLLSTVMAAGHGLPGRDGEWVRAARSSATSAVTTVCGLAPGWRVTATNRTWSPRASAQMR